MKSSASTANGQEVPSSVVTKLTVLGATGSIGINTLEIVRQFPHKFKIILALIMMVIGNRNMAK